MNTFVTWTALKASISSKAAVRFVDRVDFYAITYGDLESTILKIDTTDCTDFETNYKAAANKAIVQSVAIDKIAPFGSKTIMIGTTEKKLYARNMGVQPALTAGANQIDYTITFPWVKVIGIEIIGAEVLDYTDLKVLDAASSPYMGTPSAVLNQFAYANNIGPNFYSRMAHFDADIYQNMVIRLDYTSVSAKTIGINFILIEVKS